MLFPSSRLAVALIAGVVLSGCNATLELAGIAEDTSAAGHADVLSHGTPDGLDCGSDVREAAIYDYGEAPTPDGDEPLAAATAFFGDGIPDGMSLEPDGGRVTVRNGDTAVATISLVAVPGGWVVGGYEACDGALRAP